MNVSSMDVIRPRRTSLRTLRLLVIVLVPVLVLGAAAIAVTRIGPAAPTLERAALVIATVRRGELVRSVAAPGTLATDRVRVVSAPYDGFVEAVLVKPGTTVTAGSVIVRLRNPDLEAAVVDARTQIAQAEQERRSIRAQSRTAQLEQTGALQTVRAQREQASAEERADRGLHDQGLIADLPFRLAQLKVQELNGQERIEGSKLGAGAIDADAKAASQGAKIADLRAALQAKQAQLDALTLRAGGDGVVQTVTVDLGQRIAAGTSVARIADTHELKAVVQIPETQAHDVALSAAVQVQTSDRLVRGRVARIDPSAQNGTVNADIRLLPPLPAGLRPDSNVDATIEISRVHDTLIIARPAGASDDATVGLFKLTDGGHAAVRVPVRLGSGSIDEIAVRSGLAPGDRVIVSDTSAQAAAPRLRLQ
ncbi:MAG: efflux RND transporter periplasmic adaptor subunit [Candidatus Elarobacter sp.]